MFVFLCLFNCTLNTLSRPKSLEISFPMVPCEAKRPSGPEHAFRGAAGTGGAGQFGVRRAVVGEPWPLIGWGCEAQLACPARARGSGGRGQKSQTRRVKARGAERSAGITGAGQAGARDCTLKASGRVRWLCVPWWLADFDAVIAAGGAGRAGIREGQGTATGNPAGGQRGRDGGPGIRGEVFAIDQAVFEPGQGVPNCE